MTKNILNFFLISFLFSANVFATEIQEMTAPEELIDSIIELINLEGFTDINNKFTEAEEKTKEYAAGDLLAASVKNKLEDQDEFDAEAIKKKINSLFTQTQSTSSLIATDTQYPNLKKLLKTLSTLLNKKKEEEKPVKFQDKYGNKLRIMIINNRSTLIFFTIGAITTSYILYYNSPSELKQMLSSQEFWEHLWRLIWTQMQNTPGYTRTGFGYAQTGLNLTVQTGQTGYDYAHTGLKNTIQAGQTGYAFTMNAFNHTNDFLQNVWQWAIHYRD